MFVFFVSKDNILLHKIDILFEKKKDCDPYRSRMVQLEATYQRQYEQHNLDLMYLKKKEKEDC